MPLRSPAPCRTRTPRRRATTLRMTRLEDGSRTLPSHQTAQQHSHGAITSRRHLSSHTGPLESRRRLGKRHLTGFMPSSGFDIPGWYFEGPQGSNIWQWQAPTSVERRKAKLEKWNPSSFVDGLRKWLEDSDADKPFLQPPLDGSKPGEGELHRAIMLFRQKICDSGQVDHKTVTRKSLYSLGNQCYRSIQAQLELGAVSTAEILLALDPIDDETKRAIAQPKMVDAFNRKYRRNVLSAIQAAHEKREEAISKDTWLGLAAKLSTSDYRDERTKLFAWLVGVMPASIRHQIAAEHILSAIQPFVADLTEQNVYRPYMLAQATRIGPILGELIEPQRTEVLAGMKSYTNQKAGGSQFAWLLLRSFDSQASRESFSRGYHEIIGSDAPLNDMQLWNLMVARLTARRIIKTITFREEASDVQPITMPQRWGSLLTAIVASERRKQGLEELYDCMTGIGESQRLAGILALLLSTDRVQSAKVMYTTADNGQREILVLSGTRQEKPQWTACNAYIKSMIADPKTETIILHAMTDSLAAHRKQPTKHPQEAINMKMDLLDYVAYCYMQPTHLTPRQVFRRVQTCLQLQRCLSGAVSSRMLTNISATVTKDLERGEWGRTSRLEWLVKQTAARHGKDKAQEVQGVLNGWRWVIAQRGREQKIPQTESTSSDSI